MSASEIAARFGVYKSAGYINGRPKYAIRCPLVESKSGASVHVWDGDDGSVAVDDKHAGCENKAVRDALGISKPSGPPAPIQRRPDPKPEPEPAEPRPLPSGQPFWPPHIYTDIEGNRVLAVVRKDLGLDGAGGMRKTFMQFTPAGDDRWVPGGLKRNRPLFRLPRLSEPGRVLVVEGEKCVLACEKAWPDQIVTTWSGGSKAWQKTDWEPLRGRAISLMADADESSRTAMRQLAYYMDSELDCVVHVALPDGVNGEDVADWLEEGVEPTAERVATMLQPYEPDEEDRTEPPKPPPEPIEGDIAANKNYQLLGLDGDAVAFRIAAGRVLKQSRESVTQPSTLISIAPLDWWYRLAGAEQLGSTTARRIGDSLLRVADDLGQVDLSRVTGRGAATLDDGTVVFHLGDRLLLNGKEVTLDGLNGLDGRIWLAEPRIELGAPASDDAMRSIAEAVLAYRWDTPEDGKRFLGWLASGLVGGALEWRPHLFLSGEAATGKSWILRKVMDRLLARVMHKIADATPAALARLTENASLPIAVDEAEPSHPWVLELLKLLRISAGAEGKRVRADGATGGVVEQSPRFAALLSSTAMPDLQRADASRLASVKLGAEVDDWPAVQAGILTAMMKADEARYRIIRQAPEIVAETARLTVDFEKDGADSREAMAAAALTAGWRAWGLDRKDIWSRHEDRRDETPDGVQCLNDILALRYRQDSGLDVSVLTALMAYPDEDSRVIDLCGIKRSIGADKQEDGGFAIFAKHRGLRRELSRTEWANHNLEQLLLQVDGAEMSKNPLNFAGHRKKAVLIPRTVLQHYGIGPDADEPPAAPAAPRQGGF